MPTDAVTLLHDYFRCFKDRDRPTLERLLAENLRHTSPWATYEGRDGMLDAIWPHVGKAWAVDLQIYGAGNEYLVFYRHEGASDATLAERIVLEGEQITEIEVYPRAPQE